MSVDGGVTFPYHIGRFPNSGTASVTVPNPPVSSANCRFKVKGTANVFFNINSSSFTVSYNSAFPITVGVAQAASAVADVKIYPVPATSTLHVSVQDQADAIVFNTLGQKVWQGTVNAQTEIPVGTWSRGQYYMQLRDSAGKAIVKRFVLE